MKNLAYKVVGSVAVASLVMSSITTAAFAETIDISENGSGSDNEVTVKNVEKVEVTQTNTTVATITLNVTANSGGNTANNNTGSGGVTIDTGNAGANVTVTVGGNTNLATLNLCGCPEDEGMHTIVNNGQNSDNKIKKTSKKKVKPTQTNSTVSTVTGTVKSKSGKNKSNGNTGGGNVLIETGNATKTVDVVVEGSTNTVETPTP